MDYINQLKNAAGKFKSIVSMGLDPVIEEIPINKGSVKERIISFYESILNAVIKTGTFPGAVKPNHAFYAQYGIEGIEALTEIIKLYRAEGLPVILDAKRGDISNTAGAYANECFGFFQADAVTLAPYMGYDSIAPFMDKYPGKGYYILSKTSNKSSADFQDIVIDGRPLYIHVSEKIIEWHRPGIGAVVGATYPDQLEQITGLFERSGKEIPFLIPGIGAQGGDLKAILAILKASGDIKIHRINSSSGINYAYKKHERMSFAEAAVEELKKLNNEISAVL
jgi:orotidine-5'-phosphate decarboxylase